MALFLNVLYYLSDDHIGNECFVNVYYAFSHLQFKILCQIPLIAIDSSYYGKLVIAPLNIVKYNVFTNHGPDLYGVEPWYFYFLNCFLNFNICFVIALLTPVLLVNNFFEEKSKSEEGKVNLMLNVPFFRFGLN